MNVVLTIDNGPYAEVTPKVLDTLAERNVRAIFFVIGERLDDSQCRLLAHRAHLEGHIVANHSYRHATMLGNMTNEKEAVDEIALSQERLDRIGARHKLFRPFAGMGQINDRVLHPAALEYLCNQRFTCALWNSVPRDWEDPGNWDAIAISDVQRRDISVVVVHDMPTGAMDRLGAFIDGVRNVGGTFSTELPDECTPIRHGKPSSFAASLVRSR